MKFYKLKSGNISFEYEVKHRLNKIEDLLGKKNDDLLCGVFGAVIADYISTKLQHGSIWFVFLLIISFYVTKLFFRGVLFVKEMIINHSNMNYATDKEELHIQDVFWDKVVPEIVYGVSLVNRVRNLQKENSKSDLWYIYTLQAKRCFWEASETLNNEIYSVSSKKRRHYIKAIGADAVEWVKNTAIEYLGKIEEIYGSIDVHLEKQFYSEMEVVR